MQERNTGQNLLWGLKQGLGFAAILCVFALVGALGSSERGLAALSTPISLLLALYIGVGGVGGLLAGLLRPMLHYAWAAGVIGAVTGAIGLLALAYTPDGGTVSFRIEALLDIACLGAVTGTAAGLWMWWRTNRSKR